MLQILFFIKDALNFSSNTVGLPNKACNILADVLCKDIAKSSGKDGDYDVDGVYIVK